jgi:hypothetical protein
MRKTIVILSLVLVPALSFAVMPQPPCGDCPGAATGGSAKEAEAFFAAPPGGAAGCAAHVSCHGKRGAAGGMGQGGGHSGMMGGGMNMMGPGGAGMGMMDRCGPDDCASCLKRLGVDGAVAEQVRAACRARQKEMVPLAARLKLAEMELEDLSAADKMDLKAMEARVREVEKVRGDMRMVHLAGWQKIKALLPAEARARLPGCCLSPDGRLCPPGMPCMGGGGCCGNSPMPMFGPGCR